MLGKQILATLLGICVCGNPVYAADTEFQNYVEFCCEEETADLWENDVEDSSESVDKLIDHAKEDCSEIADDVKEQVKQTTREIVEKARESVITGIKESLKDYFSTLQVRVKEFFDRILKKTSDEAGE